MSVIDEVKQKIDIVEVIGEATTLTKSGRNFKAICPFHSEKNPSFYVYPEQQSWHCFGACNTGGDVFSFVMKQQGLDFGEALRLLADRAGIIIPSRFEPEAGKGERERLYQVNAAAAQHFHELLINSPAGEKARAYLAGRGLAADAISSFQLGYCLGSREDLKKHLLERGYTGDELLAAGLVIQTDSGQTQDRFRNKLVFPIFDVRGRVTGFGARVLDDSLPKYVNSPETPLFDKSGSLYGINLAAAAIREQDQTVIVEGYLDVISVHQSGFGNVVASMGTSVTERQINTLKKLSKNLVFALDADAAGEQAMLRCVGYENTLSAEARVAIMPPEKDPDDVIREDPETWRNLLASALPIVDYTFNMFTAGLDLATARDKSLAVERLLPVVAEIKDTSRQYHYLHKLAGLVGVPERRLEADLNKARSAGTKGRTKEPRPEAAPRSLKTLLSSPVEEECLAWLLQYPELKDRCQDLKPEYFAGSENRAVLLAWQAAVDLPSLKEKLDAALHKRIDALAARGLPPAADPVQRERIIAGCTLRLREEFLRKKLEAISALEAEPGGNAAEKARLQEQGAECSRELGEVFTQRSRRR